VILLIKVQFFESYSVNKYHRECIKTNHFGTRNTKIFWGGAVPPSPDHTPLGAFDARPPVALSDGLDTRPCKILNSPQIQRGFPVDIVNNTNLLTYLLLLPD